MTDTTLCYIEYKDYMLFLLRNKKKQDLNEGKYVGVGGKFLEGESKDECLLREIFEETALKVHDYVYRGLVEFVSDKWEDENMYLYSAYIHGDEGFDIENALNMEKTLLPASKGVYGIKLPIDCNEGTLYLVNKSDVFSLNMWAGDRRFLEPVLRNEKDINMTLKYVGEELM